MKRHRYSALLPTLPFPAWLAVAFGLHAGPVQAHGDLDVRIQSLSRQVTAQPADVALRQQRAELYRQHAQFEAAIADLAVAAEQKPSDATIQLARARVFSAAGQATHALAAVEIFLAAQPDHPEALGIRARCRLKLGQGELAVADYTRALAVQRAPEPELWLERARAQAALGRFALAAAGLDEGRGRLGDIVALQLAAIEYDRQRADFTAALARVDALIAKAALPAPWQVLRGEILAQAGRLAEAQRELQQAGVSLDNYPPAKRGLGQTIELRARVRAGLARLEQKSTRAAVAAQ